ncbi:MAG: hypothetical protein DMG30_04835 [Acidobacteria bacterium]|nr:MAG: hypothetical protein DMG30_04835 [Acidobacteriota bacterium]
MFWDPESRGGATHRYRRAELVLSRVNKVITRLLSHKEVEQQEGMAIMPLLARKKSGIYSLDWPANWSGEDRTV